MAANARIEPRFVTDVRRCLAIEGGGDGRAGLQCHRKPRRNRMTCAKHRALEADVPKESAEAIAEARRQATAMSGGRR